MIIKDIPTYTFRNLLARTVFCVISEGRNRGPYIRLRKGFAEGDDAVDLTTGELVKLGPETIVTPYPRATLDLDPSRAQEDGPVADWEEEES